MLKHLVLGGKLLHKEIISYSTSLPLFSNNFFLFPCSLIMANGESPLGHFTLWLRDKRKGKVGRKVRKNKLFRRILIPLKTQDG